jgi:hypothetical protein
MTSSVDLKHAIGLPPEQAVAYFRSKGLRVSDSWREVWQACAARAAKQYSAANRRSASKTSCAKTVNMITSKILYFGVQVELKCDGDCEHAWGIGWKNPKTDTAPADPGKYEGNDAKPTNQQHNRWCARQCERSSMTEIGT